MICQFCASTCIYDLSLYQCTFMASFSALLLGTCVCNVTGLNSPPQFYTGTESTNKSTVQSNSVQAPYKIISYISIYRSGNVEETGVPKKPPIICQQTEQTFLTLESAQVGLEPNGSERQCGPLAKNLDHLATESLKNNLWINVFSLRLMLAPKWNIYGKFTQNQQSHIFFFYKYQLFALYR